MSKLLGVVVVALGALVVWQVVETQTLRSQLGALRGEVEDLARGEFRAARTDPGHEPEFLPGRHDGAAPAAPSPDDGPTLAGPSPNGPTMARVVRDLQNRVEEQERRLGGVEEKVEKAPVPARPHFGSNRVIRDMDQAESALDLTPRQRSDMERVIEDAKRDLSDLKNIADDDGMTLAQVAKPRVVEGDGLTISMPNFGKVQKFLNQKVPGRDETFREAQERITKNAKRDVREILEPEQRKTWDQAWTRGLLGRTTPGFGVMTTAVSVGTDSAKDD